VTPKRAALFTVFFCVTGCDTATVYEQCHAEDKVGSGEPRCQPSHFDTELDYGREATGYLSYGIEVQPNATVRIADATVTTNSGGLYRDHDTPFRYDLTARLEHDVITYRSAAFRFLDIALDRETPLKAYSAKVKLHVENTLRPGDTFAFFVSGDAVAMTGSLEDGFVIHSRSFDAAATIHVVQYPKDQGILGAIAKGSVDVLVRANTETPASAFLAPVFLSNEETFVFGDPKPGGLGAHELAALGFVPEDVELILDFGTRLSEMILPQRVPMNTPVKLPVMSNAGWTARVRATRGGEIALNGRRPFKPVDEPTLALFLFDPPKEISPADGTVPDGGKLHAIGNGVLEHLLESLDRPSDPTIHVLTADHETTIPDLTAVGLPAATGRYRWTVRNYPDYSFVDQISGLNVRLYPASSLSAPRTIVLP